MKTPSPAGHSWIFPLVTSLSLKTSALEAPDADEQLQGGSGEEMEKLHPTWAPGPHKSK